MKLHIRGSPLLPLLFWWPTFPEDPFIWIQNTPIKLRPWTCNIIHQLRQPCQLVMRSDSTAHLPSRTYHILCVCFWRDSPQWARISTFTRFLDHTQRHITVGRTPVDEWSARRRPLPDNTQHSQQTNIHAPAEIRTHNLSRRAAADLRLRRRGHWNRLTYHI